MGRLIILLLLFPSLCFGISIDNVFQNDVYLLEKAVLKSSFDHNDFNSLSAEDKLNKILHDPKNIIKDEFHISEFFLPNVSFWFKVYTLYDNNAVLLHDKGNLSIVYDVIDYNELTENGINVFTKESLQSQLTAERIEAIKNELKKLSASRGSGSILHDKILNSLKVAKVKIPTSKRKKRRFFLNLSDNIRAQTGQRKNVLNGLKNFMVYESELLRLTKLLNLPKELLAISLLESSFNPKATSKVGAKGVWQFMPSIGKYFFTVNRKLDERVNPFISSIGAMKLLKQNKMILKSWDLAVVAYNSGTKHLIRARKKLKKKVISLEEVFKKYKHPHIGFASKNFYSEFLALVFTIHYKDLLFTEEERKIKKSISFKTPLSVFITKCSVRPKKIYKLLKNSSPDFKFLNLHLLDDKKVYPAGTSLVSDINLNKRRYAKVSDKSMKRKKPNEWKKSVKRHNCSIK